MAGYRYRLEMTATALEPIALLAEPATEFSFDGLFAHWAKGGAKAPRHYEATARLLRACYGNIDYRTLNPQTKDGWKFADYLSQKRVGPASQDNHLGRARAMYRAAGRFLTRGNPFTDVTPVDTYHAQAKGKFTRKQLRAILAKVAAMRFGDGRVEKRHTEVLWMLRLAVHTGGRINEIASLRKGDVLEHRDGEGAFPYLYFRADVVKAQVGEDRSRKVPLHPALCDPRHPDFIGDFIAYAKAARKEHIFGAFSAEGTNGRAAWLISNFPGFIREHAAELGIELKDGKLVDGDGKALSLHCIRHSFHVAVSTARLHADAQRVLTGHTGRDVHDRICNSGPEFHLLAADMARVRPLA